jgi:glycosyltransferase involved in cell wall biosynthesis
MASRMTNQPGRPRVAFVINSLEGGGAERVMTTLLAASDGYRQTHDVSLTLLDRTDEAYAVPDGLSVHRLDTQGGLIASVRQMRRHFTVLRPDVSLSFLTRANVATIAAMRGIGPAIISERVDTRAHLATGRFAAIANAMVRLTYPRATRVIAVSAGVGDGLVAHYGVLKDKIRVCYNPLDAAAIALRCAEPPEVAVGPDDFVALGRLVVNKNFSLAIRAFAASSATGRLIIMGEGPLRPQLEAEIASLAMKDRVLLAGFCANPYAVIARARGFILSSLAEGLPNAVIEAMACRTPAVAVDCPSGPREVLEVGPAVAGQYLEGRGGLLVPTGDVQTMAMAIDALHDDAIRARLSEAAAARAADFTVEAAVDAFWAVIAETLAAREARV